MRLSAVWCWLSIPEHVGHQKIGWWSHLNQISNLLMWLKVGQLHLSFLVNFIESSITIQVVQSWRFECLNTASLRLTFHFSPNWFCRLTCRWRESSLVPSARGTLKPPEWPLTSQTKSARELTVSWPVQRLFYYLPIVWMLLWMCLHVFIDCSFISSSVFPLLSVSLVFTVRIYSIASTGADEQRTVIHYSAQYKKKYSVLFCKDLGVQQWPLTSQFLRGCNGL